MDNFVPWLEKALVKATKIHDTIQFIPCDMRTAEQINQMIANGGKMTILKNTLDYIKRHNGLPKSPVVV